MSEDEALRSIEEFLVRSGLENEHYDLEAEEEAQGDASGTPQHESPTTPLSSHAEKQLASPDPFVFTPTPNPHGSKRTTLPAMGHQMGTNVEMTQASLLRDHIRLPLNLTLLYVR